MSFRRGCESFQYVSARTHPTESGTYIENVGLLGEWGTRDTCVRGKHGIIPELVGVPDRRFDACVGEGADTNNVLGTECFQNRVQIGSPKRAVPCFLDDDPAFFLAHFTREYLYSSSGCRSPSTVIFTSRRVNVSRSRVCKYLRLTSLPSAFTACVSQTTTFPSRLYT